MSNYEREELTNGPMIYLYNDSVYDTLFGI
jgi:hypothetical protein